MILSPTPNILKTMLFEKVLLIEADELSGPGILGVHRDVSPAVLGKPWRSRICSDYVTVWCHGGDRFGRCDSSGVENLKKSIETAP